MPITLNEDERLALIRALDNYLPELRYELARTDVHKAQHELALHEATLTRLLEKLRTSAGEVTWPMP
jgi:hypothetical protein